MRTCSACNIEKGPDEFSKDSRVSDGLGSRCYECKARIKAAYYRENPEKVLLSGCKQRAKKKGLPFNLDLEDVIIPEKCPVLGIKMAHNRGRSGPSWSSPTVDRIVPEKGYTKGNVKVISNRANFVKSNATADELMAIAKYMKEHENDV
jgi:hypothetical protein